MCPYMERPVYMPPVTSGDSELAKYLKWKAKQEAKAAAGKDDKKKKDEEKPKLSFLETFFAFTICGVIIGPVYLIIFAYAIQFLKKAFM
jgi:hypothetical protein